MRIPDNFKLIRLIRSLALNDSINMMIPTTANSSLEDITPTVEIPEKGLKSIHIHFLIVGVLFGLVIIMLGLHNYIEMLTDGGKKSLPMFGNPSPGDKAKPRATLRPVISKSKTGGSGKGTGKL